jgi:hypothetical protein
MRGVTVVAVAIAFLAAAGPAEAVLNATGTLTRTSNGVSLNVRNTGDEPIAGLDFASFSGPVANARTAGGRCTIIQPGSTGVTCFGFLLSPGSTMRVRLETSGYRSGAGGQLFVRDRFGLSSAGPIVVTGPPPRPRTRNTPTAGRNFFVRRTRGVVRVRPRGSRRFVRLRRGRLLRLGSEIDTRRGTAKVLAGAARGTTDTYDGTVSRGRAIVTQDRARQPLTTLRLSEPLACPRRGRGAADARRKRRRLFTRTKGGRFQTRGNYAAGTAQGTAWLTTDTCTTTTIRVTEGIVNVTDFTEPGRPSFPVQPPNDYVARRGVQGPTTPPGDGPEPIP